MREGYPGCGAHRCFVKHFNGIGHGYIPPPQGLLQLLQRGALPGPKDHQVDVTVMTRGEGLSCTVHSTRFAIMSLPPAPLPWTITRPSLNYLVGR